MAADMNTTNDNDEKALAPTPKGKSNKQDCSSTFFEFLS